MPDIAILYEATPVHPVLLTQRHVDMLAAANRSGEVRWYRTEAELLADGFDAEVLMCWGQDTPDACCDNMPRLRWVQSLSAGVEGLARLNAAKRPGFILSKMKGAHGYVMAETCLAYILCFLRSFPMVGAQQRRHVWNKPALFQLRECRDAVVGILGIGDIGGSVARLCKQMGMTVLGCRRPPVPMEYVDEMYPLDRMNDMLARCDFVVDLVPDTPGSRKMVGADFFAHMKPEAVFINIGRGATVDTDALVEALQTGVIAGAALDTVAPEPLDADSPLWDMENVIITPHCSADSPNYFDRAIDALVENLNAYQDGRPIASEVKG